MKKRRLFTCHRCGRVKPLKPYDYEMKHPYRLKVCELCEDCTPQAEPEIRAALDDGISPLTMWRAVRSLQARIRRELKQ